MSKSLITQLARDEIVAMEPYQSARRLHAGQGDFNSRIWMNANEAPGPGIYQLSGECLNRYPDFQPQQLISGYAKYANVEQENVLATRGADEGIELIIRTFCQAYQDNILICPPTYGMYAITAENHGCGILTAPMKNNALDIENIKTYVGKVNVVFLCSPGNPTGNLLPAEQIQTVIELFKGSAIVVVDEAYIEYSAQKTVVKWLNQYENLVILRTLSKAFALAGLRCGFTLASAEIITMLSKVIAPYPISAPVAEIASNALTQPQLAQMNVRVSETKLLANQLTVWLQQQVWCDEVFPTDANFVLFRTQKKDFIFNALAEQGILIRDQSKQQQLNNCLRISIGSERELTILKQTINQAFSAEVASQAFVKEN